MNKIIRYIVYIANVPQDFSPSYNVLLGKDTFGRSIALESARCTAINYKGVLVAQNDDGSFNELHSYQKKI